MPFEGVIVRELLVRQHLLVVGLLSVSDLFLLPSLQESFGLSALPSAASSHAQCFFFGGGLCCVFDESNAWPLSTGVP